MSRGLRDWSQALAGLTAIGLVLATGACSDGDGDEAAADDAGGAATTTSLNTGGLDITSPDGWVEVPMPQLGFGLAVPNGWEATRLDEEALASLGRAQPVVPGFLAAAHNAYTSQAVFYAAGVDTTGKVTDLKVRADTQSAVTDLPKLEAYAQQALAEAQLQGATVEVVADPPQPTVDIRFQTTSQRPADAGAGNGGEPEMVDVVVEGTERLVLSPKGVVYRLLLISEDAAIHDDLAHQIFGTLTFPERP